VVAFFLNGRRIIFSIPVIRIGVIIKIALVPSMHITVILLVLVIIIEVYLLDLLTPISRAIDRVRQIHNIVIKPLTRLLLCTFC
jgi:hypothetical protein